MPSVGRSAEPEQDDGGEARIGLCGNRDQHGGDAGEADEAALDRVMGFTERLRARENPAQREERNQHRPDD